MPSEISVEPMAIGGSALLALVLLLFIAFTSELFNSTVESNYDEISGWLRLRRGAAGRMARLWTSPLGVGIFLAAGAAVYLLLDPSVALDVETVAIYLGMLAGLGVVMLAFEAPPLLLYRRRTGTSPGVRALPWTLPAAALCVIVSRVAGLEPGYLYGLLLGLVFQGELTAGQEGRQTAFGAAWTLAVALVAWVGLGAVRSSGIPPTRSAACCSRRRWPWWWSAGWRQWRSGFCRCASSPARRSMAGAGSPGRCSSASAPSPSSTCWWGRTRATCRS